jgi:C4-type Zn-finger protein
MKKINDIYSELKQQAKNARKASSLIVLERYSNSYIQNLSSEIKPSIKKQAQKEHAKLMKIIKKKRIELKG